MGGHYYMCKINIVLCESGHLAWPGAMDTRSRDSLENCRLFGANKNCPHRSGAAQKCQFLRRNLLLTIYNLSLASSTHDLEASLGLDLVRGATTRDNLAVTRKRRSPYLRHRLASFLTLVHLSCPCLALLWPKLLAGHNLKLSHFLFGLDHQLALVPSQQVISYLSPSLTPPLRSLGPCLTCGWKYRAGAGLSNLGRGGGPPVLVHPKVAAAFKGSAANASKVHSLAPPSSSSLAPKSWQGGGRPSPASPGARGRRRKRCRRWEKGFSASATAGDATLGAGEVCSSRGGDPTVDGVEAQSRARERPAVQRLSELIVRRETKPTGSSSSSSCQQGS